MVNSHTVAGMSPSASVGGSVSGGSGNRAAADKNLMQAAAQSSTSSSSNSNAESCTQEKEYIAAMAIQILETYDVEGLLDELCYNGPASGFKKFAFTILRQHAPTATLIRDFVQTLPSFEEWRSMQARRRPEKLLCQALKVP